MRLSPGPLLLLLLGGLGAEEPPGFRFPPPAPPAPAGPQAPAAGSRRQDCAADLGSGAPQQEVRAMVGGDVELNCTYPRPARFDPGDLYVYWQTCVDGQLRSEAYHLGSGGPGPEPRASLAPERMRRGDFSLRLRNVTPHDERTFHCLVFRRSLDLGRVLHTRVALHVAANYSVPEVSEPAGPPGAGLTVTCTSRDGYPRPRVHWVNSTDGRLLDPALHNSSVTRNARGLFDVVSVLRLPSARADVSCCIENALLRQNLTGGGRADARAATREPRETPAPEAGSGTPSLGTLALLPVLVAAVAGVVAACRRSRRARGRWAEHI